VASELISFLKEVMFPIVTGCLIIILLCIPFTRLATMSITVERDALQTSLNEARVKGNTMELAAVTNTVAAFNKKLASEQYYASMPVLGWWYSDNVLKTKPVR